jgi:nucleoside-diphosphate-sugar epimerase
MRFPADIVARLRTRYEGRRACVTGGAGFIGGHLVEVLVSLGVPVTVIDDLSNSSLSHLSELIELDPDAVRFVHGSILDDAALAEAVEGVSLVFHLAAVGSVPRSIAEPGRTWAVNATGTLRVLEAAREVKASRVVLASSSSVYGDNPALPREEGQTPEPLSPYAVSKLAGEQLLAVWSRCYGFSTVSLRYFNVFGPRQAADSQYAAVVAAFAARLLSGRPPLVFGDGQQTRDFTFVSNAVLGTLLAGSCEQPLAGQAFNIGTGRRVSVAELARIMSRIVAGEAGEVSAVFEPARSGDVLHSVADITRARQTLGYRVIGPLEEGLAETVEWYRRAPATT